MKYIKYLVLEKKVVVFTSDTAKIYGTFRLNFPIEIKLDNYSGFVPGTTNHRPSLIGL